MEEWTFRHVRYFSLRWEGEDLSMFHEFMQRMETNTEAVEELDSILYWAEHIGEVIPYPLRDGYFRHEGAAMALPPPAGKAKQERKKAARSGDENVHYMEVGQLRLYCHPVNDHVVFLFSGDLKDPEVEAAQDCETVWPHFQMANALAKKINEAFKQKEIRWKNGLRDIEWDKDFELEL